MQFLEATWHPRSPGQTQDDCFRQWQEYFAAHPVNELIAQGDTVVAIGEVTFRAQATGKESSSSWVYIWKLRDGKVCSYDQFNDPGLAAAFR